MGKEPYLDILWVTVSAGLVFVMQGGFLCLESGLTRSKNNINVALKNLSDLGVSIMLFWIFGYALMFGETINGWVGTTRFLPDVGQGAIWPAVFFLYQAMFCSTAVTILSGAVAERMRFPELSAGGGAGYCAGLSDLRALGVEWRFRGCLRSAEGQVRPAGSERRVLWISPVRQWCIAQGGGWLWPA